MAMRNVINNFVTAPTHSTNADWPQRTIPSGAIGQTKSPSTHLGDMPLFPHNEACIRTLQPLAQV